MCASLSIARVIIFEPRKVEIEVPQMTISTKLMVIFERSEISRRKLSMEKKNTEAGSRKPEAVCSGFLFFRRMPDHTLTRCTEQLMHGS